MHSPFSRRRAFLAPGLVAAALIFTTTVAAAAGQTPTDYWMGMYVAGQKCGYMHFTIERAKYGARDCVRVQSVARTKIVLLGTNVQQDIKTVVYADERFTPYFETVDMSSGGRGTTIEAKFGPNEIKVSVKSGDKKSNSVTPIPKGASLVGDPMYALGADKLKVGQKARMYYFNPLRLSVDPVDVEVLRQEQIEVNGKTYDTLAVRNTTPMGDLTTWQTESGQLVKAIGLLGIMMQLEPPEQAVAGVDSGYMPPADLAVLTSIRTDIKLPEPQTVKKLTVRLSGKLDRKLAISDARQRVKWLPSANGNRVAEFTVEAVSFAPGKSAVLPIRDEKLLVYVKPSPYLDSDAPEIRSKAAEIVGNEKSAYAAASKVRAWVSSNMHPQADIGITRPAVDVLKAKVGVCRDYAVLYAALARAAGIPTKFVSGLVYTQGSFYYHAWAESFVGQWVAFDATMPGDFVDATHIKLTEGNATDMFEMARVFGNLKAQIVKFE